MDSTVPLRIPLGIRRELADCGGMGRWYGPAGEALAPEDSPSLRAGDLTSEGWAWAPADPFAYLRVAARLAARRRGLNPDAVFGVYARELADRVVEGEGCLGAARAILAREAR